MVKASKNGTAITAYTYNWKGYRVKKEKLTATAEEVRITYYTFSPNGKLLYEEEEKTAADTERYFRQYSYLFGKHFAQDVGFLHDDGSITGAVRYYLHTDHLGSVVAATDEAGETVWSNEFTPFGSAADTANKPGGGFKFASYDFDEDVQLHYARARWLDPETGRFTSLDPMKDGMNWYVYCGNNPINFIDPLGLYDENYAQAYEAAKKQEYERYGNHDYDVYGSEMSAERKAFFKTCSDFHDKSGDWTTPQEGILKYLDKMVKDGLVKGIGKSLGWDKNVLTLMNMFQAGFFDAFIDTAWNIISTLASFEPGVIGGSFFNEKMGEKLNTLEMLGGVASLLMRGPRDPLSQSLLKTISSIVTNELYSITHGKLSDIIYKAGHAQGIGAIMTLSVLWSTGEFSNPVGKTTWKFGDFKNTAKWESQLAQRGWTPAQITEAIEKGAQFDAINMVNKGNPAIRYVNPTTGKSVVIDTVTNEVLHIGGEGFVY